MRKIAITSYNNNYYSNSIPSPITKQQTTSGYLHQNIYSSSPLNFYSQVIDENKSPTKSRKKRLWSRSGSKDG
jgi:hypothetical protein